MADRRTKGKPSEGYALGFRVRSGWATGVLIGGPFDSPRVCDRFVIELSDPALPETRQPYHAATGREETDPGKLKRRIQQVERFAKDSVRQLLDRHGRLGVGCRGAGLVVGSMIDPESIANAHIRAHAYEGKLFRSVLENSLRQCGMECAVILERSAYDEAAKALGRSDGQLRGELAAMGRLVGRPWSANEKLATLAAWMSLA